MLGAKALSRWNCGLGREAARRETGADGSDEKAVIMVMRKTGANGELPGREAGWPQVYCPLNILHCL